MAITKEQADRRGLLLSSWKRARTGVIGYLGQTGSQWAEMYVYEAQPVGSLTDFQRAARVSPTMTLEKVVLEVKWLEDGTRWCRLPLFRACDVFCEGVHLDQLSGI